jgi:hypothetical protein
VSVVVPLGSEGITGTISVAAAEGAVSHSITADDPSVATRRGRSSTLRRCPGSLAMLNPHCGNGTLGYARWRGESPLREVPGIPAEGAQDADKVIDVVRPEA